MADNNGMLAEQELSPLEQEVLDEYDKLSTNMKTVCVCGEKIDGSAQ